MCERPKMFASIVPFHHPMLLGGYCNRFELDLDAIAECIVPQPEVPLTLETTINAHVAAGQIRSAGSRNVSEVTFRHVRAIIRVIDQEYITRFRPDGCT